MSIWVAGEVLIDVLPTGPVVGGGPANTAKALARLGNTVDFIANSTSKNLLFCLKKNAELNIICVIIKKSSFSGN